MRIKAVLIKNDNIYDSVVEAASDITFGSGKKDDVLVEGFEQAQVRISQKKSVIHINAKKGYGVDCDMKLNDMIVLDKDNHVVLLVTEYQEQEPYKIELPYNCIYKFGRTDDNDVALSFPFVSREHFVLRNEAGTTRVEDSNSTNGLYLNGKKIGIARMKSGDILSIMSIQIKLINGCIYIENAYGHIKDNIVRESHSENKKNIDRKPIYKRSPRIQDQLPSEDIVLASAPNKAQKYEKGRGMFTSLAGSGAMVASSIIMGMASPALLAARAASMVSPVISATTSSSGSKKKKKELEKYEEMRREKYGAYIEDQKSRIEKVADLQRKIITKENPDMQGCMDIVLNFKASLWERSEKDRDFLDIRIGMGYEDICVKVKAKQDQGTFQMEEDEVKEMVNQIIEETRIVDNVPSRVSFSNNTSIGIVGNRKMTTNLVTNMLTALCTAHCYEDVKIVGIFDPEEQDEWEWLHWLPHVDDESGQYRMIAFDKEKAHDLCETMSEIIKSRNDNKSSYSDRNQKAQLPHYIFILGSKDLVEKEEVMNQLFFGESIGVTTLFMFDELYNLPHKCEFVIDLNDKPCAYKSSEANKKFFFTPDEPLKKGEQDSFARIMSAIELVGFSKKTGLPDSITFLKGLGVEKVEKLNIINRWRSSVPYDSLAAPIGVLAGDKTFALDIHEKAYGPHGLVAGTTGSGKSELLQTWILSMAVNYHPHDVSFVLIDYKGGGMANLLEPLPHVVGKITNIGSNIGRSLISLQSEIKRRQMIFEEACVNSIDKYQKLYKSGAVDEPMPHLIIVADEFAELKKEEPDFMSGLISASRVGRSLGIHLILATQKPGGIVDDQIQSNSRFRLCLKVQDVNDSREMIKRPDAAKITRAGRSYIRVGEDEYFDIFQSYWSGGAYVIESKEDEPEPEVSIVDIYGNRINLQDKKKQVKTSDKDELTAVVEHIVKVASEEGIERINGPWLPELPVEMSLEDVLAECSYFSWPMLPIGIFDKPKQQAQGPQFINFAEDGHYAIYGAAGTGKTTILKTILFGLCKLYSPTEMSAYVIDAGALSLSFFSEMPHIGGVAWSSEEEKIAKLQKVIMDEFENRKKLFHKNSVSSLRAYREDISDGLPAIVIVVDNIVPLFDLYPDIEDFFVSIARDGATYGIYLVYTANSTSGVRYKVISNMKGAISFELTDRGDYQSIVGRPETGLPKISGRALFKGNPPIEFQVAKPVILAGDKAVNDKIHKEAEKLNREWTGQRPTPIPVMNETISMNDIRMQFTERTMIPVGTSFETIQPVAFDLSEKYSMLISGPIKSGKSRTIVKIAKALKTINQKTQLIVFDSRSGSLKEIEEIAYKYSENSNEQAMSEIMHEIVAMLNERKKQEKQGATASDHNQICILIDDLKEFVDDVSDDNRNTMERICRMAGGLGIIVIAAGRMGDMEKYSEIESLTRVIIANQNGYVLEGTPAQYAYFKNDLKYTERNAEAGEGNGYVFHDGKCIKVKKAE